MANTARGGGISRKITSTEDRKKLREIADELERIVALHDASNIAAVMIEPMAGSTGALLPPTCHLARLRASCDTPGTLPVVVQSITALAPFALAFPPAASGSVSQLARSWTSPRGAGRSSGPAGLTDRVWGGLAPVSVCRVLTLRA